MDISDDCLGTLDQDSSRAVLSALAEEPLTPSELVDATEFARPTVHDKLRRLGDIGLVEKVGSAYSLTASGKRAHRINEERLEKLGRIESFTSFLNHLPETTPPIPLEHVCEEDLVMADAEHPHRPNHRCRRVLAECDPDRVLSVVSIAPPALTEGYRHLLNRARRGLFVFDESIEEYVGPTAFESSSPSVIVEDLETEIGTIVIDDRSLVLAYDDRGMLHGVLDTDSTRIRAWITELCQRYDEERRPSHGNPVES